MKTILLLFACGVMLAQSVDWTRQVKNKPFDTTWLSPSTNDPKVSLGVYAWPTEKLTFFPTFDPVTTNLGIYEYAPAAGRHFVGAFTVDACKAGNYIGAPCTSDFGGSGDKVGLYVGAMNGPSKTTNLTAPINSSQLTIPVANTALIPAGINAAYPVRVSVGTENIWICGKSVPSGAGTLTVCASPPIMDTCVPASGRGAICSTAATHTTGVPVKSVSDLFGINVQMVKRGAIESEDANMNSLEIDVHNFREDYANTGQKSSVGALIIGAGSNINSHGLLINHNQAGNYFFYPLKIEDDGPRGICIGPNLVNPMDCNAYSGTYVGKTKRNGGDFLVGMRYTDTSPTGYFTRFWRADGTYAVFSVDVNGKVSTYASFDAIGGAPEVNFIEGDVTLTERDWRITANGSTLRFLLGDGAGTEVFNEIMSFNRIGATPIRINMKAIINSASMATGVVYANNAAAIGAGLVVGDFYRITGSDTIGVVH